MLDEQDTHPSKEPPIDWLGIVRGDTTTYVCWPCWEQEDGIDEGVIVYEVTHYGRATWRMFL